MTDDTNTNEEGDPVKEFTNWIDQAAQDPNRFEELITRLVERTLPGNSWCCNDGGEQSPCTDK